MTYILILAIIAVILGVRLFSILGRKTDIKRNQSNRGPHGASGYAQPTSQIKNVELNLEKITDPATRLKILSPSFEMKKFLKEAKNSYKSILKFYAEGNTPALSDLINIEMMRKFAYKITKREEAKSICKINVLKIKETIIEKISFEQDVVAFLRVIFKSEVIHYITNKKNKITAGHKRKIDNRKDVWTFSKNLGSTDSTWKLVEVNQLL